MGSTEHDSRTERPRDPDRETTWFDPAKDRETMRERATAAASEAVELDVYRGEDYAGYEEAFEDGYRDGYQQGYAEGYVAGLEARPGIGGRLGWDPAGLDDASGRGSSLTAAAAVLLAVGYYGLVGIQAGNTEFGTALPVPIYFLTFALLFALGLVRHLREGVAGLAFAALFATLFGVLVTFAVEGALVLFERPSIATDGAAGATVLAAALVVAFVGYWVVLSAIDWEARQRARNNAREYARARAGASRNR